ncbi:MAG: ANTAR domain-containing protein [Streptosporangiaceae bacterium]
MPGDQQPAGADVVKRLDEVTGALEDLAGVLQEEEELGRVLQCSVDQVTTAVPGADMVSVTVLRDDRGETVASSTERVHAIDADQYEARRGPCLEAARTGDVVRTGVEQARERWPEFARSARAAGVESYLSCPLLIDEEFAGTLNLYSEQPHGFADFDVALIRLYVAAAVAAIASARRYTRAREVSVQLRRALDSRAVIDQARGVLMTQRGITAEQALEELSRESQNTNVKLRDIATRLVTDLTRPPR